MRKLNRSEKTKVFYALLCVGTAAAALLCVLLSSLLLWAEERSLFGRESYVSFSPESGQTLGAPPSLAVRARMFEQTVAQEQQRQPLPDELSESEAMAALASLWNALLRELPTDDPLQGNTPHFSAILRDFSSADGSRYALWCGQIWLDRGKSSYSFTAYLDSRTGQPMMAAAVLTPQSFPLLGLLPMAEALGLGADAAAAAVEKTEEGIRVTLPLEGGFTLLKSISADTARFTIRLQTPEN